MSSNGQVPLGFLPFPEEIAKLQQQLESMQKEHLRMLAVITHALGGELRITNFDYLNAQGVLLEAGLDQQTGDLVYKTYKQMLQ